MADDGDPDFGHRLTEIADRVTVALDQLIPPAQGPEADLMRAMRHSALANGKRMATVRTDIRQAGSEKIAASTTCAFAYV